MDTTPGAVGDTSEQRHNLLVDQLVQELQQALGQTLDQRSLYEQELIARKILAKYEKLFGREIADAGLSAWLVGAGRAVKRVPQEKFTGGRSWSEWIVSWAFPPVVVPRSTVQWAADLLTSRRIVSPRSFYRLAREERDKAFTVSGRHSEQVLERIRDAIVSSIQDGSGHTTGHERIEEAVRGGNSPMSKHHIETVYRTNTQKSYNDALWQVRRNPVIDRSFPYVLDNSIADGRRRELCAWMSRNGADGTAIYRADDPLYAKLRPLRGFRCRCHCTFLTIKDAARNGVREAQDWLATGVPPADPFRMVSPPPELLKQGFPDLLG